MSKELKTMGDFQNEIREVLKLTDSKERGKRMVRMLSVLTALGPEAVIAHKNPGFATGAYFAAFTLIAMMHASGSDVPEASKNYFTAHIVAMVTDAIGRMESAATEDETKE